MSRWMIPASFTACVASAIVAMISTILRMYIFPVRIPAFAPISRGGCLGLGESLTNPAEDSLLFDLLRGASLDRESLQAVRAMLGLSSGRVLRAAFPGQRVVLQVCLENPQVAPGPRFQKNFVSQDERHSLPEKTAAFLLAAIARLRMEPIVWPNDL